MPAVLDRMNMWTAIGVAIILVSVQGRGAVTVRDGVYTEEQAARGGDAYQTHCLRCHLADLGGDQLAAPLVGETFLKRWEENTLATLFTRVKKTMPPDEPGSARDEEYAAIISYAHTPLMVGGLLYMSTGYGTVAALDAATGKVVWFDSPVRVREQSPTVPREGAPPVRGTPSRSLAYWTDGKDARVIAVTGQSLVALNAKTGRRYPDFGDGGEVDLSQGYERYTGGGYKWRSQPVIVGGVMVVGGLPGDATTSSPRSSARALRPHPGTSVATTCERASGCGRFTRCRGRASSAATRG